MLEGVLKESERSGTKGLIYGFNPWYVGGGVKRSGAASKLSCLPKVSILGMLEGVLKDSRLVSLGGLFEFQSLVCWRGC